jgi:hypothetical protein
MLGGSIDAAPARIIRMEPGQLLGVCRRSWIRTTDDVDAHDTMDAAARWMRQRELLPSGDDNRQRHRQQLIMAVLNQTASTSMPSDPVKLNRVIHDIGRALTVDTNATPMRGFILAPYGIKADPSSVSTPRHTASGRRHLARAGGPRIPDLWRAVADDFLVSYTEARPDEVNALHTNGT